MVDLTKIKKKIDKLGYNSSSFTDEQLMQFNAVSNKKKGLCLVEYHLSKGSIPSLQLDENGNRIARQWDSRKRYNYNDYLKV